MIIIIMCMFMSGCGYYVIPGLPFLGLFFFFFELFFFLDNVVGGPGHIWPLS